MEPGITNKLWFYWTFVCRTHLFRTHLFCDTTSIIPWFNYWIFNLNISEHVIRTVEEVSDWAFSLNVSLYVIKTVEESIRAPIVSEKKSLVERTSLVEKMFRQHKPWCNAQRDPMRHLYLGQVWVCRLYYKMMQQLPLWRLHQNVSERVYTDGLHVNPVLTCIPKTTVATSHILLAALYSRTCIDHYRR